MTYAGVQMFMGKLQKLINSNHIPLFNYPQIISERPQFQLLYEELGSMIRTLFTDEHQDHEKLNDLKKRLVYAAEQAEYKVDLFLSGVYKRYNGNFLTSEDFNPSLNLDDVRISLMFIKAEFKSMGRLNQAVAGQRSISGNSQNQSAPAQVSTTRGWKKLTDEIVVGLDRDLELIRDKLVEDQKKLDVVSIVGMGGIGKTTLATKVFNDAYVKHHFHVRVWVTVSQTYDKRAVLSQILESIRSQLDLEKASDSLLRKLVHQFLFGQRYFIVFDDIWHIETWDNLKTFFHDDGTGSRILLTSRVTDVAKHAKSDGLIHHIGYLNKEKSWELLCQKVFRDNECPEWSYKHGMQIVKCCQGLPLAVVVIAGVLAKKRGNEEFWVEIADRAGSYIVDDQNGCMETLALSYIHLPCHLRDCFLYFGGFPEDYTFKVQRLIWLWVAEGFIEEDGNRSLEDIAMGYLIDLIDRNLVIVADRKKSNGGVKACKVHDLVRKLCKRKAKEEQFILKIKTLILSANFSDGITQPYKPVRMFTNKELYGPQFTRPSVQNPRSILCFSDTRSSRGTIAKFFSFFVLLRVLDLQSYRLNYFPCEMELLVHLRYLAVWNSSEDFPSPICKLWSLNTLIYFTIHNSILLPSNISNLVNLRHLWSFEPYSVGNRSFKKTFILHSIEKPMNLQTISKVMFGDGVDYLQKCFPYIKELTCGSYFNEENDFKSLTFLEKLKLTDYRMKNHVTFPPTLRSLTLLGCRLPWSDMSIIQSLPNLQLLKLKCFAFEGSCWNTDGQKFPQLRFLRLHDLDIKVWEAYSTSFPFLRQLEIIRCKVLEEIPFEIGEIPTLELIKIKKCRRSVGESAIRIQEEQNDFGNYDLKIDISLHLP